MDLFALVMFVVFVFTVVCGCLQILKPFLLWLNR